MAEISDIDLKVASLLLGLEEKFPSLQTSASIEQ
jgi:hypothetical protein